MLTSFFSKHIDAHAPFFFFFLFEFMNEKGTFLGDRGGSRCTTAPHRGAIHRGPFCAGLGTPQSLPCKISEERPKQRPIRASTVSPQPSGTLWHPVAWELPHRQVVGLCLIATDEICVCLFSSSYVCERQKPHVEVAGSFLWLLFAEA